MTLFRCTRASSWHNDQPCPEAFHKEGTDPNWYVQFSTLEEILSFINRVKSSIVLDEDSITIYDDYLE